MPATDPDDATMFDLAPVSLWIEDYSAVKALFEQWRAEGVDDLLHLARFRALHQDVHRRGGMQ